MSEKRKVADVQDLDPDDRTIVRLDGRSIGVIRFDGELYALENTCRHDGGPVCEGLVQGRLEADWPGPGERVEEYFSERPAVACPWHGWEYDLETGEHLGDSDVQLETFDVGVEGGEIVIELE